MARATSFSIGIALPWLDRARVADARLPSAEWLAARGTRNSATVQDWRAWLVEDLLGPAGGIAGHPAAPCMRAIAGIRADAATWACLRPVHLLAAIDHLQVSAEPVRLAPSERDALFDDFARHYAGTDYAFHAVEGRDQLLAIARPLDCASPAPDALPGRNLRELMPRGPDAAAIAAFMNEVQMLLHEHPVNLARASRGAPPVNGLWPWGFGRTAPSAPLELPVLVTDDAWLAAAWRVHDGVVHGVEVFPDLVRAGVPGLCVGVTEPRAWDAASLEREVFAPLQSAVAGGRAEARMLLGSHAWSVGRHARWRMWRRSKPLAEAIE